MALFKKKGDPISTRARALNNQIAQLEAEIRRLDEQLQKNPGQPRVRSTALPSSSQSSPTAPPRVESPADSSDPIFESVDQALLNGQIEVEHDRERFNELGVRKYDLPALWLRIRKHFRGPSTSNPKLVNYLAAGGIQGLRPLRYEKRVARNRFIVLVTILFFVLLGLIWAVVRSAR